MIKVSEEFREEMKKRTDFKEYATVTFESGEVINLEPKDFTIGNQNFIDGAGSNKFPIGCAVERSIQIELMNDNDKFTMYDFYGSEVELFLKFQLSNSVETINKGIFLVTESERAESTVIITGVDKMYQTEQSFSGFQNWTSNMSVYDLLWKISQMLGIDLDESISTVNYPMLSKTITAEKPDGTFRDVIGYCAMFAGGNAIINGEGKLDIIPYDFSSFISRPIIDGGVFDDNTPHKTGDSVDGGYFHPWNNLSEIDGGTFEDREGIHVLSSFKNLTSDYDDITISNVFLTTNGSDLGQTTDNLYTLTLYNPLFAGIKSEMETFFDDMLIGVKFKRFSGDHISDPTIEAFDNAYIVDGKGMAFQTTITDVDFSIGGWTNIANNSENIAHNKKRLFEIWNLISAGGIVAKPGDLGWPF